MGPKGEYPEPYRPTKMDTRLVVLVLLLWLKRKPFTGHRYGGEPV
jgi:hypothetical protein